MRSFLFVLLVSAPLLASSPKRVTHFVYFELERDRIAEKSFLDSRRLEGAQLKYTWDELEPTKGKYRFEAIEKDLSFLRRHGKKVFIQIQDVSFSVSKKLVPSYLLTEPDYQGGVSLHYVGEGEVAVPEGWIARRWDDAVRGRFKALLSALGRSFDGKIAGINLPETAFSYGDREDLMPKGFTPSRYRDAVIDTMRALKRAFPRSIAMQYANFMPGEWLPTEDRGFLRTVYREGVRLGLGLGGPDLLPFKKGQMVHAYHFLPGVAGKVPTGIAAQWDNYKHVPPGEKQPVTVGEMYAFAKDNLRVDTIFWCTQEPYYSRDVIPFLEKLSD